MTKVFIEEFKGSPVFVIKELDENGIPKETKYGPFLSFGIKKANAIVEHLEELKKFVEDNKVQ
jgi:hypothetical protein